MSGRAMCARWADHLRAGETYGDGPHIAVSPPANTIPNPAHRNDPLRSRLRADVGTGPHGYADGSVSGWTWSGSEPTD